MRPTPAVSSPTLAVRHADAAERERACRAAPRHAAQHSAEMRVRVSGLHLPQRPTEPGTDLFEVTTSEVIVAVVADLGA
jgi:hypothetical protein